MRLSRLSAFFATLILSTATAGVAQPAPAKTSAIRQPDYGTSSRIQYHLGFAEFAPADSTVVHSTHVFPFGSYSTAPAAIFVAHPHLPSGARLFSLELDYCDTSITGKHIELDLYDCDFGGSDCNPIQQLFSASDTCSFTVASLVPLNYTLDNNTRQLILLVELNASDASNILTGAYIGYTLQVSPGPGTATFADVPTTSPQFKFVEALYAAGITAGCGSNNYCPNQPLTRGQMAVFLATAMGLHYPN